MSGVCRSAKGLSLPTTYIEWRGGRASTLAEAGSSAEEAAREAAVQGGSDEELEEEDDDDSELASSSESEEDVDIEMPAASPPGA